MTDTAVTYQIPKDLEDAVTEASSEVDAYLGEHASDLPCEELNEDLGDFDEGTHPWDGWTWGYDLRTYCSYAQTLESPAEYETEGRVWLCDPSGHEVKEWTASQLW